MPYKDKSKPAEYMLGRYYKRRHKAITDLGSICVKCGTNQKLELDHIYPNTKKYNIGVILSSGSENKVKAELLKCQLLCKECHVEKSVKEAGKSLAQHGTLSGYRYCKCVECTNASRNYQREYRRKKRASLSQQQDDSALNREETGAAPV